jgi:hypothetical protein
MDLQTRELVIDQLIIQRGYDLLSEHMPNCMPEPTMICGISPVASKGNIRIVQRMGHSRNTMEGGVFWDTSKYNDFPIRVQNYILSFLSKTYFHTQSTSLQEYDGSTCLQMEIPFFSEYQRLGVSY